MRSTGRRRPRRAQRRPPTPPRDAPFWTSVRILPRKRNAPGIDPGRAKERVRCGAESELDSDRDSRNARREDVIQLSERRRVELSVAPKLGGRVHHVEEIGGDVEYQRTGDFDVLRQPEVEVPQVRVPSR